MTDDSPSRPDDAEESPAEPPVESDADDVGGAAQSADAAPPTDDAPAEGNEREKRAKIEESEESEEEQSDDDRLRRYVERAILAVLFLFAIVVAFRFYFAASNAVSQWVARPYQSLFQAAFNLVVLLVVGAGIARQLRRMR